MIKETMPVSSDDTIILFCGPPSFKKDMAKHLTKFGHLKNIGFFRV